MTTSKRTSKSQSTSANKAPSTLIYVGPSIKGLTKYSTFVGGYPKIHEQHKENCPAFTTLFVEPKNLNEINKKLENPNSRESILYKNVANYFKEAK